MPLKNPLVAVITPTLIPSEDELPFSNMVSKVESVSPTKEVLAIPTH